MKYILRQTLLKLFTLLLLASFPASLLYASTPALKWPRPELIDPITLDVTDNSPASLTQRLDKNKDYIIRLGKDTGGRVSREAITIIGGRNIHIIGGHFRRPDDTPASDSKTGERLKHRGVMLGVSGHTGTFYAEGLVIDVGKQYGVDAIAVGAPPGGKAGDHIFQNIHIRGVHGTSIGLHADGLQVVGAIRKLWLHKITIISSCQGIVIAPLWPLADVRLDQVNLRYENPDYRTGGANAFALWLGNGKNTREQINTAQYDFNEVYVQERTNYYHFTWADSAIAPGRKMPKPNMPYNKDANKAHFPEYNSKGYITRGIPPGGDFVSYAP